MTPTTPYYTRHVSASGKVTYRLDTAVSDWDRDYQKPGTCRLVIAASDGLRRYAHDVTPDTAGWAAAATIARIAMERAIQERSAYSPVAPIPYTKKQLAVLAHCKKLMVEAGMLMPTTWTSATPHEVSQAAIDAVRNWKP